MTSDSLVNLTDSQKMEHQFVKVFVLNRYRWDQGGQSDAQVHCPFWRLIELGKRGIQVQFSQRLLLIYKRIRRIDRPHNLKTKALLGVSVKYCHHNLEKNLTNFKILF